MDTKSLENANIAVCLMGQSRTFRNCSKNINKFFSSNRNNKFYFFGHTWNTNTYKVKDQETIRIVEEKVADIGHLEKDLRQHFKFENLIVEEEIYRPYPWASMLHSTMRANFLKQKFEAENNMMFDFVVKARFDVCYDPAYMLENIIHTIEEKTLYSNFGLMRGEFFLPNPDDVIYAGSSLTMDIIDSLYNNVRSEEKFDKLFHYNIDNRVFKHVGPGPLIHKWMSIKNILPRHVSIPYAVRRLQTNKTESWEELRDQSRNIF